MTRKMHFLSNCYSYNIRISRIDISAQEVTLSSKLLYYVADRSEHNEFK